MPGVLEESFHIEELELDDVVVTPEVPAIPQASPHLPQTDEMVDSATTTPSTSTDVRMLQSVEEITDEKVFRVAVKTKWKTLQLTVFSTILLETSSTDISDDTT